MTQTSMQESSMVKKLGITGCIDCDSHVEEPEAAWQHLEPEYAHRRPIIVDLRGKPGLARQDAYWLVDGRQFPRPFGPAAMFFGSPPVSTLALNKPYSVPSQTLEDIKARLADMDRNNIKRSVIFPTTFLANLSDDVRFEAALMRSYNTWIAGQCAQSGGRVRFVAMIPFRSPVDAVAEVKRAKGLGAAGLYCMGTAGEMLLNDPRLDPVWGEAERQNLSVCVHVGYSHPGITESVNSQYVAINTSFLLPMFLGFVAITGGGVLDRHPGLKFGFFEAGGDWLPYFVGRMEHYYPVCKPVFNVPVPLKSPLEYLKEGRMAFSVEGHEPRLPEVIKMVGEDNVMASADMPHSEGRDSELEEVAEREDIPVALRRKMLTSNTERFYGFKD